MCTKKTYENNTFIAKTQSKEREKKKRVTQWFNQNTYC